MPGFIARQLKVNKLKAIAHKQAMDFSFSAGHHWPGTGKKLLCGSGTFISSSLTEFK
jgi:hypothetical protein